MQNDDDGLVLFVLFSTEVQFVLSPTFSFVSLRHL
jgi:hypothetical protein